MGHTILFSISKHFIEHLLYAKIVTGIGDMAVNKHKNKPSSCVPYIPFFRGKQVIDKINKWQSILESEKSYREK